MTQTPQTCGKGLAANSGLPGKLSELLEAQANVLERHMQAIDTSDPNACADLDAYARLSRDYRAVASQLDALAKQMASYQELPMPQHDVSAMTAPGGQTDAFRGFVALERELVSLLEQKLEAEARMLA